VSGRKGKKPRRGYKNFPGWWKKEGLSLLGVLLEGRRSKKGLHREHLAERESPGGMHKARTSKGGNVLWEKENEKKSSQDPSMANQPKEGHFRPRGFY